MLNYFYTNISGMIAIKAQWPIVKAVELPDGSMKCLLGGSHDFHPTNKLFFAITSSK